jgi:hypothetical protein
VPWLCFRPNRSRRAPLISARQALVVASQCARAISRINYWSSLARNRQSSAHWSYYGFGDDRSPPLCACHSVPAWIGVIRDSSSSSNEQAAWLYRCLCGTPGPTQASTSICGLEHVLIAAARYLAPLQPPGTASSRSPAPHERGRVARIEIPYPGTPLLPTVRCTTVSRGRRELLLGFYHSVGGGGGIGTSRFQTRIVQLGEPVDSSVGPRTSAELGWRGAIAAVIGSSVLPSRQVHLSEPDT